MRAALSLSLSSVVGQNASLPSLLLSRLTGAPSLSAAFHALSKPLFDPVLTFSHSVGCDMGAICLATDRSCSGGSSRNPGLRIADDYAVEGSRVTMVMAGSVWDERMPLLHLQRRGGCEYGERSRLRRAAGRSARTQGVDEEVSPDPVGCDVGADQELGGVRRPQIQRDLERSAELPIPRTLTAAGWDAERRTCGHVRLPNDLLMLLPADRFPSCSQA